MAKTKKKKTTHRRRRVGAMALNPSSTTMKLITAAAGFLMATPVNAAIDKVTGTSIDQKLVAGGQVGLGAWYLMGKGKKNMLLTIASGVVAGAGLKRGMKAFGIGRLGGYGRVPTIGGNQRLMGYGQVDVLNGFSVPGTLNGYETPGIVGRNMNKRRIMGSFGDDASGSGLLHDHGTSMMG